MLKYTWLCAPALAKDLLLSLKSKLWEGVWAWKISFLSDSEGKYLVRASVWQLCGEVGSSAVPVRLWKGIVNLRKKYQFSGTGKKNHLLLVLILWNMDCFSVGGTFLWGGGLVFQWVLQLKGFLHNPEPSVSCGRGCSTALSHNRPLCYPLLGDTWPSSSAAAVKCSVLLLPAELSTVNPKGLGFSVINLTHKQPATFSSP